MVSVRLQIQETLGITGATAVVVANDAPVGIRRAAWSLKASLGALVQICDGTNDGVEIQAATDEVEALGAGTVAFIGNTFYVAPTTSYALLPKTGVNWVGNGTEFQINATNMIAATAPNDWRDRIIGVRIDSITNCVIRGLTFRLTGTPSDLNYTVRFIGTSDETTYLEDCLIYNDTTGAGETGDALHFGYQTTSKAINCRAYSSTKSHSGGIVIGGNASNFPRPTLVDCYGETRASGTSYSAGIWIDFASPTIIHSIGQGGADEDSYGIFVHHIDSKARFIGCIGYSGDRVDNCGLYLDMQASPTFIGCVGVCEGAGYYAWAFASTTAPILTGCVAEYGDTYGQVGYSIIENAAPRILSSTVKLAGDNYAWEYDDVNNGQFQPYAATHYQLINIAVEVVVENPTVTLNIGTTAGGSQIASVDIGTGTTGHRQIDLGTKLRFASGAYMYASVTPEAIADGDVIVQYEVVKDLGGCNAVQFNSSGPALIEGCTFYATDGDDVVNIGANAGTDYQFVRCYIENYTLASNAINFAAATTLARFYDCTIIGAINNVTSFDDETPTPAIGETRVATGNLSSGGINAFAFTWQNPHAVAIVVKRVMVDVTTAGGTGGSLINVGTAANGTTGSDNLIDGADLNAAAVYDNIEDRGTNGKSRQRVDANAGATDFVTGQITVAAASSLVGKFFIEYQAIE